MTQLPLPLTFPSRTNLKLHKISTMSITNLDSSKMYVKDYISVVVMQKYELERSSTLAELFNLCLRESCFPDSWKVISTVSLLKNVCKKPTAKDYHFVGPVSVVIKGIVNLFSCDS